MKTLEDMKMISRQFRWRKLAEGGFKRLSTAVSMTIKGMRFMFGKGYIGMWKKMIEVTERIRAGKAIKKQKEANGKGYAMAAKESNGIAKKEKASNFKE